MATALGTRWELTPRALPALATTASIEVGMREEAGEVVEALGLMVA